VDYHQAPSLFFFKGLDDNANDIMLNTCLPTASFDIQTGTKSIKNLFERSELFLIDFNFIKVLNSRNRYSLSDEKDFDH